MSDQGHFFQIEYRDKDSLYSAYMPLLKEGGLVLPNVSGLPMGAPVFLLVKIPGANDSFAVSGKVAWLGYNRRPTIGVRLSGDEWSRSLRTAIQNTIGGMASSPLPTLWI